MPETASDTAKALGGGDTVIHAPMTITIQGDASERTVGLIRKEITRHEQVIVKAAKAGRR